MRYEENALVAQHSSADIANPELFEAEAEHIPEGLLLLQDPAVHTEAKNCCYCLVYLLGPNSADKRPVALQEWSGNGIQRKLSRLRRNPHPQARSYNISKNNLPTS
jgi:hypothetical protein